MTIRALLIFIFTLTPFYASADDGGKQFIECSMPVVEYTTGNMGDDPEWFYSDSVQWVIETYFPYPNAHGLPGHAGWIVIIRMITDGDDDLEDFVMHPLGLAQVKVGDAWILQADFEYTLCDTPA